VVEVRCAVLTDSVCLCASVSASVSFSASFIYHRGYRVRGVFSTWQHFQEKRKSVVQVLATNSVKTENVAKWIFHDLAPLPLIMRHTLSVLRNL
jgi:hypothetical protein